MVCVSGDIPTLSLESSSYPNIEPPDAYCPSVWRLHMATKECAHGLAQTLGAVYTMEQEERNREGADGMEATKMDRRKRTPTNDLLRGALGAALGSVTRPTKEVLARRAEILRRAAAIEEAQAAEARAEEEAADREIEGEDDAAERPLCPRLHGLDVLMFLPNAEAAAAFLLNGDQAIERELRRDAAARRRNPTALHSLPPEVEKQHPDVVDALTRLADLRDAACVAGGKKGGRPRHRRKRQREQSILDRSATN